MYYHNLYFIYCINYTNLFIITDIWLIFTVFVSLYSMTNYQLVNCFIITIKLLKSCKCINL